MSTPDPCTSKVRWAEAGTCLHALAAGWINVSDLCTGCNQTFRAALDASVADLRWHPAYLKRAGGSDA